jgi:hypothetical protein
MWCGDVHKNQAESLGSDLELDVDGDGVAVMHGGQEEVGSIIEAHRWRRK